MARYSDQKIAGLLADPGIVRNRLKVNAAVTNARAYLKLQENLGSFDQYLWQFVNGRTIRNRWTSLKELPTRTAESDAMSKSLRERGFKFVGSTICYAFMQAVGMVNDHLVTCFRHREVARM
jgi:DNA-3-methyladenine glycosylase I